MKSIRIFIIAAFIYLPLNVFGQSGLDIFGFYQVKLEKTHFKINMNTDVQTPFGVQRVTLFDQDQSYTSSAVQQANIFLRKELNSTLTSYMSFQFLNNFSTEDLWGNFRIDEAWLNYEYSTELSIKAGYLIPKFNYMNEVKDKFVLLPYIIRPLVYEASLSGVINSSDFLPEKAFLQVSGKFFIEGGDLNYAVYAGQSESAYIVNNNTGGNSISGTDTSKFKSFGGRLGADYGALRLGFSYSQDKDNQHAAFKENVTRKKFGGDFGFSFENFYLESEIIKSVLSPKNIPGNINKLFYYSTLEYDITPELFAYATYSYLEDKANDYLKNGMKSVLAGSGYRVTNDVVVKLQYGTYWSNSTTSVVTEQGTLPAKVKIDVKGITAAISILF